MLCTCKKVQVNMLCTCTVYISLPKNTAGLTQSYNTASFYEMRTSQQQYTVDILKN